MHDLVKTNDEKAKSRMKVYADNKLKTQENNFKIGDEVIMIENPRNGFNKAKPRHSTSIAKITDINGSMITVQINGKLVTRNTSFFLPYKRNTNEGVKLHPIQVIEPVQVIQPTAMLNIVDTSTNNNEKDDGYIDIDLSCLFEEQIKENMNKMEGILVDESIINQDESEINEELIEDLSENLSESSEEQSNDQGVRRSKRVKRKPNRYSDEDESRRLKELKEKHLN